MIDFPDLRYPAPGYNYSAKSLKFSAFAKIVSHSEEVGICGLLPASGPFLRFRAEIAGLINALVRVALFRQQPHAYGSRNPWP